MEGNFENGLESCLALIRRGMKYLFPEMLEPGMSALYVVFGTMIVHGPHAVGANVLPICCGRGSERLTRTDLNHQVGTFFGSHLAYVVKLVSFWGHFGPFLSGSRWDHVGHVLGSFFFSFFSSLTQLIVFFQGLLYVLQKPHQRFMGPKEGPQKGRFSRICLNLQFFHS